MKKAIVLLSGGLDSATVLAIAKNRNFEIYALSFFYGQKHQIEIESAKKIAKFFEIKEHKIAEIDLRIFGNSALTSDIKVPKVLSRPNSIPVTYVPARNTIFLSYSLAYAEVVGAFDIFIGANAVDYSNYPDCRSEFVDAFEKLANLATAESVKSVGKKKFEVHAPLIAMSKKEIIKTGVALGVDYSLTHSCYDPRVIDKKVYSCGECDSCRFRLKGFEEAGVRDGVLYVNLPD